MDNIIEVSGLSRNFRKTAALEDVSFSVTKGSVYGLVGENGAGKTTLMKHLLGLLKAESGSVRVFGMDPVEKPAEVLGRIGYLSEDRDLPVWVRVGEYIQFRKAFYPGWDDAYEKELIDMFSLDVNQKIHSLSRGQLARLGLLTAIAYRPELLVLDEPSSGLDAAVRHDILAAIIRTVADEGRTVVFSSHLLDEVQRVSDHVGLIVNGRMQVSEPIEQFLGRHTRWTVRLQQPLSENPTLDGVVKFEGNGLELKILSNGSTDQIRGWLNSQQAEVIEEVTPGLEEVFVEFRPSEQAAV